jgi:hypothetical protein
MISVVYRESGSLQRRLGEIAGRLDPRSSRMDRLRDDLKKIAVEDNTEKILGMGASGTLAGVDRFGRPLVKLGKWAYGKRFLRRGNGPVLAPHGLGSRVITRFRVVWQWTGAQFTMIAGWVNLDWMIYHLEGGDHLPQRDVGGISPKGMAKMRARFKQFAANLLKYNG